MAVVAVALVSAGCGGNDTTGDPDELASCLTSKLPAFEVSTSSTDADLLAEGAGIGPVSAKSEDQEINIAVERTTGDAQDTADQYDGFSLGQVDVIGTVTVAYNNSPTDEESSAVEDCLDDQGVG